MNADAGKLWKQRLQLVPDPFRQVLAGGVFQTGNVVQIVVIQTLVERFEDGFQLTEIPNPTSMWIHWPTYIQGNTEGVAMQPPAFVSLRYVRQTVRRLECEFFEYFHCMHS